MDTAGSPSGARLVTFRLEDQVLGLPLESVVRVERAAAVTPLPGAPPSLMGALNHHGRLLPVLDLRRRLRLPMRELAPDDQFLLVRCGLRVVVVPVDRVEGIVPFPELVAVEELSDSPMGVEGLVASDTGVVVVQDPERLLNPAEESAFESAVAGSGAPTSEPPP